MNKIIAFLAISLLATAAYTVYLQPANADVQNPPNPIVQNNWEVPWSNPTTNDGLAIGNVDTGAPVKYKGANTVYDAVITDARIPSIYVTYPSGPDVKDQLGAGSAIHRHKVNEGSTGFRLEADYFIGCTESQWQTNPPNGCYRYKVKWIFYNNDAMYPWLEIYGPGFTDRGVPTYETRWRFNTGVFEAADDGIGTWTGSWTKPTFEHSSSDASPYTPEGYKWKVFDWPESGENLYVDPYSPDSAVFWYLRHYSSQIDIPNENPGSNIKTSPGEWDTNEVVQSGTGGQDNVHWYVAQSYYGNCSVSIPCVPGGTWWAKSFP